MENKVLVETSARHVHLSAEHIEALFGKGATLTNKKELSQPGSTHAKKELSSLAPRRRSLT